MASTEEEVVLLLAKVTDSISAVKDHVNNSTRQNDTARLSTLTLAQEIIESSQKILDKIWDRLDEVVHGEAEEDEIISISYTES